MTQGETKNCCSTKTKVFIILGIFGFLVSIVSIASTKGKPNKEYVDVLIFYSLYVYVSAFK